MQLRGCLHLFIIFLSNRSTNFNETWNITFTYIKEESCGKIFEKVHRKKVTVSQIFHHYKMGVTLCLKKKSLSVLKKMTLCLK